MDDAATDPLVMPLDLLRKITNDFSEERKLGSGSFGKVYKGVHQDGRKIAVKMLHDRPGLDDDQFQNEFKNLTRLRHENIVRLVGYCHDIQEVQVQHEGKLVLAEKTHRALCLEYMSNGSLNKYLSDGFHRYDWHTGYGIISGICKGLKYLHNELKPPIYHLDLKPANVLLDENMVPRIADFGMSRLFTEEQTRATRSFLGTIGYLPPEYIHNNLISNKFDIFSLGVVIIKIMAGRTGYYNSAEMPSQKFIDNVQKIWKTRLHETLNLREAYSKQIKICIEIGLSCVQEDRHQRPSIQHIVDRLNETVAKCTCAARKDQLLIYQNLRNQRVEKPRVTLPHRIQEANRNSFPQSDEDPNHRHAKQVHRGSTFNQDTVGSTHSKEDVAPKEARLNDDSLNDNQEYSADVAKRWPHQKKGETKTSRLANKSGMPTKTILKTKIPMTGTPSKLLGQKLPGNFIDSNAPSRVYSHKVKKFTQPSHTCNQDDSLPGIESFQIVGNPRPGSTLRACGFPSDGTVLCNFQWVRFLEHYYLQYIEGATMYDYVVTVDDVGALLAVDCIPMDDNGREVVNKDSLAGHLVREFANNKNIIKCDLEMQNDINIHISRGRTEFDVFLMKMHFPEGWEQATLVLTQTGYQVILQDEVLIDEKYSPNVQLKIPRGQTTEFDLVRPSGVNLAFNTWKITGGNTYDNDIRLRNLIVLVMRAFQNKASMSPSVPRKKDAINSVAKTINIDDLPSHTIAEPPALTSNKKRWISSFFIRKRPGCVKLAMQIDGY